MSTVVTKIENILTSEYSTTNFVELMQEIFDSMKIVAPNNFHEERSNFSSHIVGRIHIGNYTTPENKKIAIFAVQLKKENYVESSRSTQRSYAKKLIEGGNCDAAIVAFYTDGEPKWRLSFVRLDYEMKIEKGKLKTTENLTPAKRYSFLVGRDEPSHTAIERFRQFILDQNCNPTLDQLEEAFSVEKVTKEFFELYCEKFYQLQEYLDSNRDFVEESKRCGFTSEQYAKKLMGQIVFLYFLQKKGWLGVKVWTPEITEKEYKNLFFVSGAQGRIIKEHLPNLYIQQPDGNYRLNSKVLDMISDDDEEVIANYMVRVKTWGDGSKKFLRTIFDYSKSHKGHFYENYLEPLFYDTLNKNRGEMGYCPALHCRIPFLSGGLFEPLDGYDWKSNNFDIPDDIFSNKQGPNDRNGSGILDVFDRYNFTISEDEPMEREVAIDPEMLGKIFENLLEVRDRKSKGAFYTPREIVHYMCQESLINYLVRKTEISEDALRDFILYGDFMKDEDTVKEKREGNGGMFISEEIFKIDSNGAVVVNRFDEIDKALATVRVADPAVGSGAFPLGMVNEIVRARENITAYITIGMGANKKRLLYKNERSPYALKLNAIRNSIFAVDIEPSAVDITQLRLWLSLVIDDEITPSAANELEGHKNPLPLPNLECNILCGNSLIDEFMSVKLLKDSDLLNISGGSDQVDMDQQAFETILEQLLAVQDKLFLCDDPIRKAELKSQIQSLKDMIIAEQLKYCSQEIKDAYKQSTKQSSKPFILWQLDFSRVFRENGGFDIVIGNPPYVSTKGQSAEDKKMLEKEYGYADDLYYHFIDKGFRLLSTAGTISYITPDTYFTTMTKENLRKLILKNKLLKLVQLGHDVFESAMVSTAILVAEKNSSLGKDVIEFIDVKNRKTISGSPIYHLTKNDFEKSINGAFYIPTPFNQVLCKNLYSIHNNLITHYFPMVATSRDIAKNQYELDKLRNNLSAGDWTLIGLVTDGGQGMATANNGRFIGVRNNTKDAARVRQTRVEKLAAFNAQYHCNYEMPLNEFEIWDLFEKLKDKYGRDIFGQGYLYKIIPDELLADLSNLTSEERERGIAGNKTFVPYDKGDKDGNRWYYETPYLIDWSQENVDFLKTNSGKKGQGMPVVRNAQFYFREGFCYSDIKTFFLKAKMKGVSIHDVKSMSLFPICDSIPYYYLISLLNTEVVATIVYNFLNNTPSFQINDCRMLPIPVPSYTQLEECKYHFDEAVSIQMKFFAGEISFETRDEELACVQEKIDAWACELYGVPDEFLKGPENYVR